MKELFSFSRNGNMIPSTVANKAKEFFKILHPDKTTGMPKRVRFVAVRLLETIRFALEAFKKKTKNPGLTISIDPPSIKNFPVYGSQEFSLRVDPENEETLTQPTLYGNGPRNSNNGNGVTRGNVGATGTEVDSDCDEQQASENIPDHPLGLDTPFEPIDLSASPKRSPYQLMESCRRTPPRYCPSLALQTPTSGS